MIGPEVLLAPAGPIPPRSANLPCGGPMREPHATYDAPSMRRRRSALCMHLRRGNCSSPGAECIRQTQRRARVGPASRSDGSPSIQGIYLYGTLYRKASQHMGPGDFMRPPHGLPWAPSIPRFLSTEYGHLFGVLLCAARGMFGTHSGGRCVARRCGRSIHVKRAVRPDGRAPSSFAIGLPA